MSDFIADFTVGRRRQWAKPVPIVRFLNWKARLGPVIQRLDQNQAGLRLKPTLSVFRKFRYAGTFSASSTRAKAGVGWRRLG